MGDRSLPEPNKIIALRQQLHTHAQHQHTLQNIKPVLSHSTVKPKQYTHLTKRDKQKQTKISEQATIQHNNTILLNKMKHIINNSATQLYTPPFVLPSLNYDKRKHEFQRIQHENMKLHNKIDTMKSDCNKDKLLSDYAQTRTYVQNISKFQPHIQKLKQKYAAEVELKYQKNEKQSESELFNSMSITVPDKLHISDATCLYSEHNIPVQYNSIAVQTTLSVYKCENNNLQVIGRDNQQRSTMQPVILNSTLLQCMHTFINGQHTTVTDQLHDILQCFQFVDVQDRVQLQVKHDIIEQYTTVKQNKTLSNVPKTANKPMKTPLKSPTNNKTMKTSVTAKSPKSPSTSKTVSPTARQSIHVPQHLHADTAVQHNPTTQQPEILSGPLSTLKSLFTTKSHTSIQQYNIQYNIRITALPNTILYPMIAVYSKHNVDADYTFVTQTERLNCKSTNNAVFVTKVVLQGEYSSNTEYMFSLYNAANEATVSEDDIVATKILTLQELLDLSKQNTAQLQLNAISSDQQQHITIELIHTANNNIVAKSPPRPSQSIVTPKSGYNVHISCTNINTDTKNKLMCALYVSGADNQFNYIGQSEHIEYNKNPVFSTAIALSSDTLNSTARQLMFAIYTITDINKPINESNQLCSTQCITIDDLMSLLSITQDKQTVVLPLIKQNKLFDSAQITLKLVPK